MVQMKDIDSDCLKYKDSSFISHMVQMKVKKSTCFYNVSSCLYIPHGSDESSMRYANEVPSDDLYIPHGSDERRLMHLVRNSASILYIPHGSDESL